MDNEDARFSARRRNPRAQLLTELAQREASTVGDLLRAVDIDPGYLYRILVKFESDGLITRQSPEEEPVLARGHQAIRWPRDRRVKVAEMQEQGFSAAQIADTLKVSRTTISEDLKVLKLEIPRGRRPQIIRLTSGGHAAMAGLNQATERKTMHVSTSKNEARTAELLNQYGQAKFMDRWDPPGELPQELNEYGDKEFGEEYWPGSPWAWIGVEQGDELCRLLGAETSDQVKGAAEW